MRVQNVMNSLWDIRIFLGLVPKESPCIIPYDLFIFEDFVILEINWNTAL